MCLNDLVADAHPLSQHWYRMSSCARLRAIRLFVASAFCTISSHSSAASGAVPPVDMDALIGSWAHSISRVDDDAQLFYFGPDNADG